jgi:hypothetical protein
MFSPRGNTTAYSSRTLRLKEKGFKKLFAAFTWIFIIIMVLGNFFSAPKLSS